MTARFSLPTESSGPWHVLHTKSRQEKVLSDTLQAMGVAHFLPLVKQVRYYGRHKLAVEVPLFPSYIFMRGDVDQVYRADRTKRVAKIIPVPDQKRLDWELKNVQMAIEQDVPFDAYPFLTAGTRVEVRAGPFRGVQGLVDERTKPDRLILQIDMLGRAVSVELDGSLLDRID